MSTTSDEAPASTDDSSDEGDAAAETEAPSPPSKKEAVALERTADAEAKPPWDAMKDWLLRGAPISKELSFLLGFAAPAVVLVTNMWRVRPFTIDDAYISYRYARNFANGEGLVYNAGERIEGYTNFLWTIMLSIGLKFGADPNILAKILGAASAIGALYVVWTLSGELRPYRTLPCVATWLLASTIVFTGYAVFGLETPLFVALVLGGITLFLRETGGVMRGPSARADAPEPTAFPWSGLVFALAGLTRPEAPLYLGVPMLFLGHRFFGKQNLIRGALFAVPVGVHLAFRRAYYGAWVPNTLSAKTGNLDGQVQAGWGYVTQWAAHQGPVVWLALFGVAIAIVLRRLDLIAITTLALLLIGYVVLVGGDWMPFFRFMAPFEPLCFLLVDIGARQIVDRRERAPALALALFAFGILPGRLVNLHDAQKQFLSKEKVFWDKAAGGTAKWLLDNGEPGEIAIGDIGYVGYMTNYPLLDLLGLVDPVIATVPGGYTQKLGPGFRDRFFDVGPKYALIISSSMDCTKPSVPGSQVLYRDERFRPRYSLAGKVPLDGGFAWCIYKNKAAGKNDMAAPGGLATPAPPPIRVPARAQ